MPIAATPTVNGSHMMPPPPGGEWNNKKETTRASSLLDVVLLESGKPTVWRSRSILFKMIRPTSIPGIVLFHFLGIHLVTRMTTTTTTTTASFRTVASHPSSWLTLLMINLVSASSMIVNDYYDAKLGRDQNKLDTSRKYLLRQDVSNATVRRFLMQLYGLSLLVVACLPGTLTRLLATLSLMMTYLYTKHLKPKTFVKNLVCAGLIAFAPVTSGLAARAILLQLQSGVVFVGGGGNMLLGGLPADLWRLAIALFCAVFGREVYMDCNDMTADQRSGIRTIPVVYGKRVATMVAQGANVAMALLITTPPAYRYYRHGSLHRATQLLLMRRLVLAGLASFWQVMRGFQIIRTRGDDKRTIERTVNGGLWVLVLLLASFL
jgi:4-hydroxybenzoate polyprenyltransferase